MICILDVISIPNHSRDPIILIKLNILHSWKECGRDNSNSWYNSLNWSYLNDADAFFQFRVLIRILELVSIPKHSRDSFIIIKFEYFTLMESVCECNSNLWYNSLNWLNLFDADAFFQFRGLIWILDVISIPNHSKDPIILIKLNTLHSWKDCGRFYSNSWYNSLNWSYLDHADDFFQFRGLIRILELISIPNHSRDSFILIESEYFTLKESVCECQFIFVV